MEIDAFAIRWNESRRLFETRLQGGRHEPSDDENSGRWFLIPAATPSVRGGRRTTPSAAWIGQDGKDFVANNNRQETNDVQDVHIALSDLDPAREITYIDFLPQSGEPRSGSTTTRRSPGRSNSRARRDRRMPISTSSPAA